MIKVNLINSSQKEKDYLPHAQLYPSTDLAQSQGTMFCFFSSYTLFKVVFRIANFFSLSTTEET
jgi:hypothetical protein